MNQELTPEQQKDVETRSNEFIKRLAELSKELQIDLMGVPMPVPLNNGVFGIAVQPTAIDTKYNSKVSPIQKKDIIAK